MIFKGQMFYKKLNVGTTRITRFDTKTEHILNCSLCNERKMKGKTINSFSKIEI